MSIVDEITRLTSAKADIKAAIEAKGVSVPSSAKLDAFPSYVSAISGGAADPVIQALAVTANGTYIAPNGIDGYSPVTVYVQSAAGSNENEIINRSLSGTYVNDTVTFIGEYAFYGTSIQHAAFPNVTNVRTAGFMYCPSLRTINLPAVTSLGRATFSWCFSLASVSFPELVSTEYGVFTQCGELSYVSFPKIRNLGSSAFERCSKLREVFLGASLTKIGATTFSNCTALSEFHHATVSRIYDGAFYNCSNLETVNLPNVSMISVSAFAGCSRLQSAVFPLVSQIYSMAFFGCTSLKRIYFAAISYAYGTSAFANCTSLSDIYFKAKVGGASYFAGCSAIPEITDENFPTLTNVSDNMFQSCTGISRIVHTTMQYLRADAFADCTSLRVVKLWGDSSATLRQFSISAFLRCSALESIYLLGNATFGLANRAAFSSTPLSKSTYLGHFGSIYVPASLLASYKTATNWTYYSSRFVGLTDEEIAALPF